MVNHLTSAIVSLSVFALCTSTAFSNSAQEQNPLIPSLGNCYGFRVYRLDGKRAAQIGPQGCDQAEEHTGYFAPAIHPDQDSLAAVKCRVKPLPGWNVKMQNCSIVVIDLPTHNERSVPGLSGDHTYGPLIWLDDGNTLVMFQGQSLLGVDPILGTIRFRFEDVSTRPAAHNSGQLLAVEPSGQLWVKAYREKPNGREVRKYGKVQIGNKRIDWKCCALEDLHCNNGCTQSQLPEMLRQPPCKGSLCFLLGVSPCGRYQYYEDASQGWFSSTWLKINDLQLDRQIKVKRLEWSLYSK